MKLDDAAARLEALGNPTRLKIYRTLVRAGAEGMAVGRLQERLDAAASTLSIISRAGRRRAGNAEPARVRP